MITVIVLTVLTGILLLAALAMFVSFLIRGSKEQTNGAYLIGFCIAFTVAVILLCATQICLALLL